MIKFKVNLSPIWKFKQGDNDKFKLVNYDDDGWQSITLLDYWSNQKYRNYNGHGWYRLKFKLPERKSFKYCSTDSVVIFIGLINDYYSTFLNGKQLKDFNDPNKSDETIAQKLDSTLNYRERHECKYIVSVNDDRLNWGDTNTIAVHVINMEDDGGFHSDFPPYLAVVECENYIQFNKDSFYTILGNQCHDSVLVISNIGSRMIEGNILISTTANDKHIAQFKQEVKDVKIPPKTNTRMKVSLPKTFDPICVKLKFIDKFNKTIQEDSIRVPYVLSL